MQIAQPAYNFQVFVMIMKIIQTLWSNMLILEVIEVLTSGKITVYGIPEICFWKIRNSLLIYHTWYKRDIRKNTEISAMRSVPKPHQPPHLLSFGISMFLYRKEKLYRSSISIREDINMKKLFFRALPESPNPQFGQHSPLFLDAKTTFCAYDREKNRWW